MPTANWLSSNYAALDAAGFVTDGKVNSMDIVNNLGSNIDLQNSWQNTLGGNNFWTQHPGA